MANINFKYNYPYCGYGETGMYQAQWDESRTKLNGSYTYPMSFNILCQQGAVQRFLVEF